MEQYVIGVDVGTGSVRAGIFNLQGKMLGMGVRPIAMNVPEENYAEQSSDNIWKQTCASVKEAVKKSGISAKQVSSISFDATCSLVALGEEDKPLSISKKLDPKWNIIMWMDHRAQKEADEINSQAHEVLRYVGGSISVEMEVPKLMWLKRNLPKQYKKGVRFFDLADFMQYKACGAQMRSSCTVTCKWTYLAHDRKWSSDFFERCGIPELIKEERIGTQVVSPGTPAGNLTPASAKALGLSTKCLCVVGMIDAHAGGIGAAGAESEGTLSIIAGTSACHMINTKDPIFVPGVWGPYYGAMVNGLWLNEGGQSSAGSLLDYTIKSHAGYSSLQKEAKAAGCSVYELLNREVETLKNAKQFNGNVHMLGYHHGNRSPRADASLRGMICGLSLDMGKESLVRLYWAAVQSVCYGTRHIIEESVRAGHQIKRIVVCGGATKNPLWLQELADITGYDIHTPGESEAVLLGSAVLAAGPQCGGVSEAAKKMCKAGKITKPKAGTKAFHDKKYGVFLQMYADQMNYRKLMA